MRRRSNGLDIDMVLSFHPNIVAHENILCAGRLPNKEDETAMARADAIIVPQGPSEQLYRLCRKHCPHVFPDYTARFAYPGKLGQARLFQRLGAPFPVTFCFDTVSIFRHEHGNTCPLPWPCIFKSNWGGEGDEVFLVDGPTAMERCLKRMEKYEASNRTGFLLQNLIRHGGRSLRVVTIGEQLHSYWRQQPDRCDVITNIRSGAVIDHASDPDLQEAGRQAVQAVCRVTGINLAGFDLLFPVDREPPSPFFLEINYFFGRRGLGGSERYYELLDDAVKKWLGKLGLSL